MDNNHRLHKYVLVRTQFHGGGVVSSHRSLAAAEIAQRKYRSSDCTCGCACVVERDVYRNLASSIDVSSPYRPCR